MKNSRNCLFPLISQSKLSNQTKRGRNYEGGKNIKIGRA